MTFTGGEQNPFTAVLVELPEAAVTTFIACDQDNLGSLYRDLDAHGHALLSN